MKKVGLLGCGTAMAATVVLLHCSSSSPNPPPAQDFVPDSGTDTGVLDGGSSGGLTGLVTVSPSDISFGDNGLVNCGTQAPSAQLTIKNDTSKAITVGATMTAGGDLYSLSPSTLGIATGQTGTITIIPKAIPAASAITAELYSGNIEVRADPAGSGTGTAGNSGSLGISNIKLHQTARGAILVSTAAKAIDFGGVKFGTSINKTFSVTNSGNVPINLKFDTGSAVYKVTSTASIAVNATAVQTLTFSPAATQVYTDTITVSVDGSTPLCAPPIGTSDLSGTGTAAVGVDKGNLAFGKVNCGTAANYQVLTIDNSGPAMTLTPTFGKGPAALFTLANDADGSAVPAAAPTNVGAASTYKLRVIPKTVVAPVMTTTDGLSDNLTLTTNSPGDVPHVIQLTETAQGAYIGLNTGAFHVADAAAGHAKFTAFSITNTGNLDGTYVVSVAGRSGTPAGTFLLNAVVGGGTGSTSLNGSLPANGGTQQVQLQTTTPANWGCAGLGGPSQLLGDMTLTPSAIALCSDPQFIAPLDLECN